MKIMLTIATLLFSIFFSVSSTADCYSKKNCGGSGQKPCVVTQCLPSCSGKLEERGGKCLKKQTCFQAKKCGANGQKACKVSQCLPSCSGKLKEFNGKCTSGSCQSAFNCGGDGQKPCTVNQCVPSCTGSLKEFNGKCASSCQVAFNCGGDGQAACKVNQCVPSCQGSLKEFNGMCTSGSCQSAFKCGGDGQKPCTVNQCVPSCTGSLLESNGQCAKSCQDAFKCGGKGQKACTVNQCLPSCKPGNLEKSGSCEKLSCGKKNQTPCRVYEQIPSCSGNLVEDFAADKCIRKADRKSACEVIVGTFLEARKELKQPDLGIVQVAIDRAKAEQAKMKDLMGDMLGKDKVLKQLDDMSRDIASQLDPFNTASTKMYSTADEIFTPEFLCSATGKAVAEKFKDAGFKGDLAKALDLGNATIGVSMGANVTVNKQTMSFSIDVTSDLVDGGGIYYSIGRGMSSGDDGGSISVSANWEPDFQSDCPIEMPMGFAIDVSGETGIPRLDKLLSHAGLGWAIPACKAQLDAKAFIPSFSLEKTLLEVPAPSESEGASFDMGIGMGISGTIVEFK